MCLSHAVCLSVNPITIIHNVIINLNEFEYLSVLIGRIGGARYESINARLPLNLFSAACEAVNR